MHVQKCKLRVHLRGEAAATAHGGCNVCVYVCELQRTLMHSVKATNPGQRKADRHPTAKNAFGDVWAVVLAPGGNGGDGAGDTGG